MRLFCWLTPAATSRADTSRLSNNPAGLLLSSVSIGAVILAGSVCGMHLITAICAALTQDCGSKPFPRHGADRCPLHATPEFRLEVDGLICTEEHWLIIQITEFSALI